MAATLESNAPLLDQLGANSRLNTAVAEMKQRLQEWIERENRKETASGIQQDERFVMIASLRDVRVHAPTQ